MVSVPPPPRGWGGTVVPWGGGVRLRLLRRVPSTRGWGGGGLMDLHATGPLAGLRDVGEVSETSHRRCFVNGTWDAQRGRRRRALVADCTQPTRRTEGRGSTRVVLTGEGAPWTSSHPTNHMPTDTHSAAGGGRPERGGAWAANTVKRPPHPPAQPPAHQPLGSANAETTPARAPAAAADRTQRPDATCEGTNG